MRWNGIKKIERKKAGKKTSNAKKAEKKTERKKAENVNIYILKHLDANHFIDMSIKKICEYIYFNNIQGGKS